MPASLKLVDFSDRDLLYVHADVADEDGWATAEQVAQAVGLDHPRPAQCVGSRYAWLYRYGLMEQQREKGEVLWRPNEVCEELVFNGTVSDAQRRSLENLSESKRADAIDALAALLPAGSRQSAHLGRRAWMHRMSTWRDPRLATRKGRTA